MTEVGELRAIAGGGLLETEGRGQEKSVITEKVVKKMETMEKKLGLDSLRKKARAKDFLWPDEVSSHEEIRSDLEKVMINVVGEGEMEKLIALVYSYAPEGLALPYIRAQLGARAMEEVKYGQAEAKRRIEAIELPGVAKWLAKMSKVETGEMAEELIGLWRKLESYKEERLNQGKTDTVDLVTVVKEGRRGKRDSLDFLQVGDNRQWVERIVKAVYYEDSVKDNDSLGIRQFMIDRNDVKDVLAWAAVKAGVVARGGRTAEVADLRQYCSKELREKIREVVEERRRRMMEKREDERRDEIFAQKTEKEASQMIRKEEKEEREGLLSRARRGDREAIETLYNNPATCDEEVKTLYEELQRRRQESAGLNRERLKRNQEVKELWQKALKAKTRHEFNEKRDEVLKFYKDNPDLAQRYGDTKKRILESLAKREVESFGGVEPMESYEESKKAFAEAVKD